MVVLDIMHSKTNIGLNFEFIAFIVEYQSRIILNKDKFPCIVKIGNNFKFFIIGIAIAFTDSHDLYIPMSRKSLHIRGSLSLVVKLKTTKKFWSYSQISFLEVGNLFPPLSGASFLILPTNYFDYFPLEEKGVF